MKSKVDVDLGYGFFSDDLQFHEWCVDYHSYLWDNADFELSKMQDAKIIFHSY